jgi:hypothetical protein
MGSALGLTLLATLAELRASQLQVAGPATVVALNGGYHIAFLVAPFFTAGAAALAALMLRQWPSTGVDPSPLPFFAS